MPIPTILALGAAVFGGTVVNATMSNSFSGGLVEAGRGCGGGRVSEEGLPTPAHQPHTEANDKRALHARRSN